MLTTWVLFIGSLLGGTDLYVYVENDYHTRSQHVLDALQTPIGDLYQIAPNNASRAFLDDLEWDRCALSQYVDLHILTRDDAGIASYQELPAYSFSSRENPAPLHPQCYLHWQMVPEHLLYIAQIRSHSLRCQPIWGKRYFLGSIVNSNMSWIISSEVTVPVTMTIDDVEYRGTEQTTTYRLIYEPCPPIDIPMPITIFSKLERTDGTTKSELVLRQWINTSTDHVNSILQAADMGTGIIYIPKTPTKDSK